MKRLLTSFIFVLLVAVFFCSADAAVNLNQTYTFDEDFDNGTMAGLEHDTIHNQLQLSNPPTTIPFIWVPNSNTGTVSKVDTITGKELARYRVSPYSYSSPSRTTVDLQGNCWVANRQTGTAVKIGLYENGGCIDSNLNGIIETSKDLNDDGVITGDELLPWGADECVLYDIILIPGKEGTYTPGQYTGGYANDGSDPGPRGIAVDAQNNVWVGTYATMKFYYINGSNGQIIKTIDVSSVNHKSYGAIIDENGIIWSSGQNGDNVLRLNPENNSFSKISLPHYVYGLGIDRNNHLFISGWVDSKLTRINTLTGAIEWTKACPTQSRGITVTDNGDVWVANSFAGTVTKYTNNGDCKATISVGNTPTGLSMDADGKVWVVNYGDEYIHRINPATNSIDLSKRITGGLHYGYSDMTGAISRTITTKLGTWIVIHDSGINDIPWGVVSWNSYVPTGTSLKVQVRSSDDKINWSIWEEAQNGIKIISTPPGRYLQVLTTFQIISGNSSPILYDLSIKADVADLKVTVTTTNISPHIGDNVKITFIVRNNGPSDANGVKAAYHIPSGLKHLNFSSNLYNPLIGWWNIGSLTSGSAVSLEIRGKVENIGLINNTAIVSGNQIDPDIANNNVNVLLKVYPNHGITSGNSGNGNSNSDPNGNHYGNSGQTNYGSVPGNSAFNSYVKNLSEALNQYSNGNIFYGINRFIFDSVIWSLRPSSLNGNSAFNPYGKTPSQILNHYFGNYMPSALKDNAFLLDLIGWAYGSNPLFQHMTRFNSFSFNNYEGNKASEATSKAWQTGNIWDFFNYDFYHFYGYSNLDKMWGGKNIKWVLNFLFGIDQNGNMSVGNFLLNLATIIPIARVSSVVGKLLVRYLPKAGAYVMKSRAVQFLLKNKTVQTIFQGINNYLITPLKRFVEPILKKFPKFRIPSLNDIGKRITKISDLINLSPKAWIETAFRMLSKSSWANLKGLQIKIKTFDKLKLWGKLTSKDITNIIDGGINTVWKGMRGSADFFSNIFAGMTPSAVKKWVNSSVWRKNTFGWIKNVTNSKFYKDIHGVLSPVIKRNMALRSVNNATKKINQNYQNIKKKVSQEYKQIKKQGIRKYVKNKYNSFKKTVKNNKYVKKYIKPVYNKYIKPAAKRIVSLGKTIYYSAKKGLNGFKKWIGWR